MEQNQQFINNSLVCVLFFVLNDVKFLKSSNSLGIKDKSLLCNKKDCNNYIRVNGKFCYGSLTGSLAVDQTGPVVSYDRE